MPNISFDIFYDNDVFNFTASRGKVAKVKPDWKVRTAPKLPPKTPPQPPTAVFSRPPKITGPRIEELPDDDTASVASAQTDRKSSSGKPAKLGKPKSQLKATQKKEEAPEKKADAPKEKVTSKAKAAEK